MRRSSWSSRAMTIGPAPAYLAPVAISTQRLLLRAPALGDARAIGLLAGDYDVASMTGTIPHPYSEEMAVDWIESLQAGDEGVAFAVDLDGELIGCVGYRAIDKTHAEMGYWIGKPYWGMGYATEAAQALILYAFEQGALRLSHRRPFQGEPGLGAGHRQARLRAFRRGACATAPRATTRPAA